MEAAQAAVKQHLAKAGHHDTTVHETVAPAVTNEHVTRTQHEQVQTAIDREVHQDHYHTTVQPIKDREVLPEEHKHRLIAVEHRDIHHGDNDKILKNVEAEKTQFQNSREVGEVQHTKAAPIVVAGEHVHHHVHETIQPVIQKETVAPTVVHTTIPIHEVHHNEARFETATALPPVTMEEFRKQGGSLNGREERTDGFAGEPRATPSGTIGVGAGTTSLTEAGNDKTVVPTDEMSKMKVHDSHGKNERVDSPIGSRDSHELKHEDSNGKEKKEGLMAKIKHAF